MFMNMNIIQMRYVGEMLIKKLYMGSMKYSLLARIIHVKMARTVCKSYSVHLCVLNHRENYTNA